MKRLIVITAFLAVALSCVDKDPSWRISWENQDYEQGNNPNPGKEQDEPQPQTEPDVPPQPEGELAGGFIQDFGTASPEHFLFRLHNGREDFRYLSSFPSLSELYTDILLLRLDPKDAGGADNGSRITFDTRSSYGSYSIRVKMPDLSRLRLKTDAVFEFGVERKDDDNAVSAISMQWKLSEPTKLTLSLASGTAQTPVSKKYDIRMTDIITNGFDASSRFYTYGFDWKADSVEWWVTDPSTKAKKTIKAENDASSVPVAAAYINAGAWHTSSAPRYPFEIEIDSISYTEL